MTVPFSCSAYRASEESVEAEIGKNAYGDEYLEDYGMSRDDIVSWLKSHEDDNYYLGTPYVGKDYQSPNGDISYNGIAGMNCAGLVAHIVRKAGLDCEAVMEAMSASGEASYWGSGLPYDLLSGASNWYLLVQNTNIRAYYFDSFDEMFESGHAEMGDIILLYVNKPFGLGEDEDNHLGVYWGETGTENLMWQEVAEGCVIKPMSIVKARILLIKTSPEEGISLSSAGEKLQVGSTVSLEATSKGTGSDEITWTSSDASVAEVSSEGEIKALSAGTAVITASSGDYEDKCTVTVTGPEAPEFTAKLIGSNKVRIDWEKVDGAAGYRVYRSDESGCVGALVADISGKSTTYFVDAGLAAHTDYYYTVRSYVTLDGQTVLSAADAAQAVTTRSSRSTVTGSYDNAGNLNLSWKAVTGAEGYDIYSSTDGVSYSCLGSSEGTSYLCMKLEAGKSYYFMIKPYSMKSEVKSYSDEVRLYRVTP